MVAQSKPLRYSSGAFSGLEIVVEDDKRQVVYWVKCDRDVKPNRYVWNDMFRMLDDLSRLMVQRGPIEFMIRES